MAEKPEKVAEDLKKNLGLNREDAEAIRLELEAQRAAPSLEAKPLAKSLTVRAAIANMLVPIIALKLAQYLGLSEEQAWEIAATLFTVLVSLVAVGLRRAQGLA